jgi:hypothetical protein
MNIISFNILKHNRLKNNYLIKTGNIANPFAIVSREPNNPERKFVLENEI